MTARPGFADFLARLAKAGDLRADSLSAGSGVPEGDLQTVLEGAEPSASLLRRLAPVLGLHAADLFVIAGTAIPGDLVPRDPMARTQVPSLMKSASYLPAYQRTELRRLVRSLPRTRAQAVPAVQVDAPPTTSVAAVLARMVRNRNLEWTGMAKVFLVVTGRYWSASTYAMVADGRKALTPDLVADFATVLGIPGTVVAALTGVPDLPEQASRKEAATAGLAELLWDLRSLTEDQVRQLADAIRAP